MIAMLDTGGHTLKTRTCVYPGYDEEISLLEGWRFVSESNPAALRIYAWACAQLADLLPGWREK